MLATGDDDYTVTFAAIAQAHHTCKHQQPLEQGHKRGNQRKKENGLSIIISFCRASKKQKLTTTSTTATNFARQMLSQLTSRNQKINLITS